MTPQVLKMMLQVLPDSGIPSTWLNLEKNLLSSDLPSGCSFDQDSVRAIEPKPYYPHPESIERPFPAAKRADQFRMRSWMEPPECRSRILGSPSRKKSIGQGQPWRENLSDWRQPFGPFEPQSHRMQTHELQHQSMPQDQCCSTDSRRAASITDVAGRGMACKEKCLRSTSQIFDSKSIKVEDSSPTMFQPVPKSNLHLVANNWPTLTDTDDGREVASGFDYTESSTDAKVLSDLQDNTFFQSPGLTNDGTDKVSPFKAKGSPDTGSATTDESYVSGPGSFPWSTYKMPMQYRIQAWPGQLTWTHMSCPPNGLQNLGFPNMEFDHAMSMSGLPTLSNDLQGPEATFVPGACASDFNFGLNREQAAMDSRETFGASSFDTIDSRNPYPPDHSMYCTESWQGLRIDGGDQERRNFTPIACLSETRNAFLLESKRRGLSYKDIKKIGGFKEAESTLRGRFRTLTKSKEQRVRKPQWQPRDVSYLSEVE